MLMPLDSVNSPFAQESLRAADAVMTFDPETGSGETLDGQLSLPRHRPLPLAAQVLNIVHVIAASPAEIEQARQATERAKGRMLHIDRQRAIAAGIAKLRAQAN